MAMDFVLTPGPYSAAVTFFLEVLGTDEPRRVHIGRMLRMLGRRPSRESGGAIAESSRPAVPPELCTRSVEGRVQESGRR
jgi:hypothetical protein